MTTVTEEDTVVVSGKYQTKVLGDGFSSTDEVEEFIQENFRANTAWTYGIVEQLGSMEVSPPEPKDFSTEQEQKLEEVEQIVANDDSLSEFVRLPNRLSSYRATRHRQIVRYGQAADFKFNVDPEKWTLDDRTEEDELANFFSFVVGEDVEYLGYNRGYKQRGGRDPYVEVFGMVPNQQEQQFISHINNQDIVEGIYWTNQNLSAIGLHKRSGLDIDDVEDLVDAIVVLRPVDEKVEQVSEDNFELANSTLETIENATEATGVWIGHSPYHKKTTHVAIGVTFEDIEVPSVK
jgi:hypothetical protein